MLSNKDIAKNFFCHFGKTKATAIAEVLGVKDSTISKWKSGAIAIPLEKLVLLAELKGVSLDQIVLNRPPKKQDVKNTESEIDAETKAFASIHGTMQWQGNMKNVLIQIFDKQ